MRSRFILLVALVLSLVLLAPAVGAASTFASPAFEAQWKQGEALAPNFWGPLNLARDGQQESYKEAPGGQRLVQYFDKARMELTNSTAGIVTNGLLTVELSTGRVQLGDATFEQRTLAHINVAGDPGSDSVTYADLTRLPYKPGRAYVCTDGPMACTEQEDRGNPIAPMFAAYIDRVGLLTVGLPITSPFVMTVNIAGQRQQVWGQAFERRVLTLAGELPNTRIEFGNIGQHYYHWRYPNGAPVPATGNATGNAPATGATAPPTADQMNPFGPAAPLTQMYTDPQGRFALKYPAGWHLDATLGMRHAVGLTGSFTTLEMVLDVIGQTPTPSDEIDAFFKAGWVAQGVGATFSQEAIRDGQIGGEPAKFYTALLSFTRDGKPVTLNVLFAVAFHGSDAYAFFASSGGAQLARLGDITAMIGSLTFLK